VRSAPAEGVAISGATPPADDGLAVTVVIEVVTLESASDYRRIWFFVLEA